MIEELFNQLSFSHFLHEFWIKNGDPLTSTLPGMETPWFFFFLGIQLMITIKIIIPSIMQSRKPLNIKPIGIILSGLGFGTTLSGLLIITSMTTALSSMTNCHSYSKHNPDLNGIVLKYVGYTFIICKLFDFSRPLLSALSKKETSTLSLLELQLILVFSWIVNKFNPGGSFTLFGLLETGYQVLIYGYLVFAGSSSEMRPRYQTRIRMKNFIRLFRWLSMAFPLPYYLYQLTKSDCPSSDLHLIALAYIGLSLIVYPMEIWRVRKLETNYMNQLRARA